MSLVLQVDSLPLESSGKSLELWSGMQDVIIRGDVEVSEGLKDIQVRSLGREDPWRKMWLPTPIFLPGELHGLCSPLGRKESDMTERLSLSLFTRKQGFEASPGHMRGSGGPPDYTHF